MKRRIFQAVFVMLLVLCLTASTWISPLAEGADDLVEAGQTEMVVLPPMEAFAGVPLDGTVRLIDGTAVKWIYRVALPNSIRDFYDTLVEGSDNDGIDDILIEDTYYLDEDYTITVATETLALNGRDPAAVAAEAEDRYAPYLYAVFGAFDRDHPEVFWLSNAWSMGCSYVSDGKECTISILVGIRQIRATPYLTEASIRTAIAERDAAVEEICKEFTWETTRYERIVHFNDVLTKVNQYNTSANLNDLHHDCRECVSALMGRIGGNGPVCEGYARAFKVLCDANGIPCVLVDGTGNPTPGASEGHMWNYVQIEDKWYGVDVTWNDPVVSNHPAGAVSGYESEDWLLVGSETQVDGRSFASTHHLKNQVYAQFLAFTNGPELNASAYESALSMALNLPVGGYVYDGTAKTPQVVVKYHGSVIRPNLDYSVCYSENREAGTATVMVSGKGSYNGTIMETFVIAERELIPVVTVEDKIYDGTDEAVVRVSLDPAQLVAGDEAVHVSGVGAFVSADAGESVSVVLTLMLAGDGNFNYRLVTPDDITATIQRRGVTVRADDFTMVGTESEGWLTYTVDESTPLVAGDRLVGKLDFDPNGSDGRFAITQGTLTNENNPNYDITFVSATLTILPEDDGGSSKPGLPDLKLPSDPFGRLDGQGLLGGGGWWMIAAGVVVLLIAVLVIVAVCLHKRNRDEEGDL